MGFFGRVSNTWGLMGQSWEILKQDKELLVFPLLSGICCLLVIASFAIPMIASDSWMPPAAAQEGEVVETSEQVIYYGKLFLFYFANYLVIIFFNSAVVGCVSMRMHGQDPTLADGFRIALSRIGLVIGWSLVAATVGLILRIIEDKNEKIGRIIAGILGMAWTAISFLVLPVMVIEGKNPIAALKDSTTMLKRTWGEQLMSNFSFGFVFFLLGIPAYLVIFLCIMSQSTAIIAIGIGVAVIYLLVLALIQSTLQTIFQTALYYYASDGKTVIGFDSTAMSDAMYQR